MASPLSAAPPPPRPLESGRSRGLSKRVWVVLFVLMTGIAAALFFALLSFISAGMEEEPSPHMAHRTIAYIDRAVGRYHDDGLDATLDYHTERYQSTSEPWYLIVLDSRNGSVVLDPHRPAGWSLQAATTDTGTPLVTGLAAAALRGGGWVSTHAPNKYRGLIERAHFYAVPVDEWVFTAAYYE